MPTIYVMRRASGKFFTVLDTKRLAVWSGKDTLAISCSFNRELDLYKAVMVTDKLVETIKQTFSTQGICSVWLVEPQTTTAKLTEGRLVDWSEIEKLRNEPDDEAVKVETPKVKATIQEFQFN
jgi:hypothetical protein